MASVEAGPRRLFLGITSSLPFSPCLLPDPLCHLTLIVTAFSRICDSFSLALCPTCMHYRDPWRLRADACIALLPPPLGFAEANVLETSSCESLTTNLLAPPSLASHGSLDEGRQGVFKAKAVSAQGTRWSLRAIARRDVGGRVSHGGATPASRRGGGGRAVGVEGIKSEIGCDSLGCGVTINVVTSLFEIPV